MFDLILEKQFDKLSKLFMILQSLKFDGKKEYANIWFEKLQSLRDTEGSVIIKMNATTLYEVVLALCHAVHQLL